MNEKLKTLAQLQAIVERARSEGKTVVFANGCFDLIHVGHVRYLAEARRLGDLLIVAVNGDSSVRALKGPHRPLLSQEDRAELLAALEMVDFITIFDDRDVRRLLRELRPHIQAKGTDYTESSVPERDVVLEYGGQVRIAGDPKDHSTRDLIARIRQLRPDAQEPPR